MKKKLPKDYECCTPERCDVADQIGAENCPYKSLNGKCLASPIYSDGLSRRLFLLFLKLLAKLIRFYARATRNRKLYWRWS